MTEGKAITADTIRKIAIEKIVADTEHWSTDDDNGGRACYIAGIAVMCKEICEELETSNKD